MNYPGGFTYLWNIDGSSSSTSGKRPINNHKKRLSIEQGRPLDVEDCSEELLRQDYVPQLGALEPFLLAPHWFFMAQGRL